MRNLNQPKQPEVPVGIFRAEFLDENGDWDGYSYAIEKPTLIKDVEKRIREAGGKVASGPQLVLVPLSVATEIGKRNGRSLRTNRDLKHNRTSTKH